jgi:pimeloyl-ACP methyl ester carboxylesterase
MAEQIRIRVHNPAAQPTLVYLPGLHGDWTLISGFREALGDRVRFVELAYPHTNAWSLEDYAQAVESCLARNDINKGWLLGESFGSQVVWPLTVRRRFEVAGVILAGGFAQHPVPWGAAIGERMARLMPLFLIKGFFHGYALVSRLRFRNSRETVAGIQSYVSGFNEQARRAITHRLGLVAKNDPCTTAQALTIPLYALSGVLDPIVPWFWVRSWLRRECPALKDYRIFWRADHNVLGTASIGAAEQIVAWMSASIPPT